ARAEVLHETALMGPLRQRRLVEDLRSRWDRAAISLRGSDLIALGVPRGPLVGSISRALRLARAAGRVRTRRQEKALAVTLLTGSRP
ncbi:MAG TPA: hypothetical protein VNI57_02180, partial [Candidatus Saccharimonadales bacterium]|nr:hypothetical protein [Candidatus Saccharimonadales bacterium]